jgi:hypothetical protein
MTTPMPSEPSPEQPAVAAYVVTSSADLLDPCLAALERQVYGVTQVFVVGGGDEARQVAGAHGATWKNSVPGVMKALDREIVYVWRLSDRARPRPDALAALVKDGSRVEAAVAGCKIVDADDQDLLVSVGYATDVFDAPYSGLQPGEVDQEQYDVIRDVAALSGASMLIRRDLFFGLRGFDPHMAPTAGAIDFCQRARLLGGRVVVVPSAEVLLAGRDSRWEWRERAGEIRAMFKVYGIVTLLWAIPLAFVAGLVEGIISPFFGRWRLFGFVAAWLWSLLLFPSTIVARVRARRGRVIGDEELFRFQTGGSARMRELYDESLSRLRERFPDGALAGFSGVVKAGQERLRRPAVVTALLVVGFAVLATRTVVTGGTPVVGYSLPPAPSAFDALGAYAGGWNPAGLGSPEVLRPEVAATAVVQLLLLNKGGLAVSVLILGAFAAGAIGTGLMLRRWGVGSVAGYLAGVVLMAGPTAKAIASGGGWSSLVALAAFPWVLFLVMAQWPSSWPARIGRITGATLGTGIVGVFAPAALVVPAVAMLLWALVGMGRRWDGMLRVFVALVLALPLLMPWILYADLLELFRSGAPTFWAPAGGVEWVMLALLLVALVGTLVGSDRAMAAVAGWGGALAVLGALAARTGDFGVGREGGVAGLMAVALGSAVVVGAALESWDRRREMGGARSGLAAVGFAAAALVLAMSLLSSLGGRAGLPEDQYSGRFAFMLEEEAEPARVLVFGPAEDLPGEARDLEGIGYRVFTPPYPYSWESYLNEPRLGDDALEQVLTDILDGEVRRAGERLAPFGIGWVVFLETLEHSFETRFEGQLDMVSLPSLDFVTYRSNLDVAVAATDDGTVWLRDGTGYRSPDGADAVNIAVNADYRWGPGEWSQEEWANRVDTSGTDVHFAGYVPRRNLALAAAAWLLLLVTASVAGRVYGREDA